ncbi:MAG: DUF4301 family protein [Bacteroidales bacterium]
MHQFTDEDLNQITEKGLTAEDVEGQIQKFITGFPYVELEGHAKPGTSIKVFDNAQIREFVQKYNTDSPKRKVVKFIPASGAASRMFKHLFRFMEQANEEGVEQSSLLKTKEHKQTLQFFSNLEKFAFTDDLKTTLAKDNLDLQELLEGHQYSKVLEYLLTEKGLNYGHLPKALLKFHRYDTHNRLALEEHLVEGVYYTKGHDQHVHLHFTVSPEHLEAFHKTLEEIVPKYENHFGVTYEISFSEQKGNTDIIAVDEDNKPFRDAEGRLLFRPGGHGALISNLNDIDADLIFIKNIDNVVPDHLQDTTYIYKKALGGYLLKLQEQVFSFLKQLNEEPEKVNPEDIRLFLYEKLGFEIPAGQFENLTRIERIDLVFDKLNRPIRVCGMVKNMGEPGGGPFSVNHKDNTVSLQIVEKAQIDIKKEDQRNYLESATHFNPVDIVCSTRDYKGEPFDLKDFVDPQTGLITYKSQNGKTLKAQERPGLWNGAMADWNTAFVEVPLITFNPVKTINDLLRKEHQPKQ